MAHDAFAHPRDRGIALGGWATPSVGTLAGAGIGLGFFDELGKWLETAVNDVVSWVANNIEKAWAVFREAVDWLLDGPIFHIAAGVCALIPGAGPGIAASIEAVYWTAIAVRDQVQGVEEIVESAVSSAKEFAAHAGVKLEANVTPAQARAKLDALQARGAAGDSQAANAYIAALFQAGVIEQVRLYPDLNQKRGVQSFARDERLSVGFRATAAAFFVLQMFDRVPESYGSRQSLVDELSRYLRGERITTGNIRTNTFYALIMGLALPMPLVLPPSAAGRPPKLIATPKLASYNWRDTSWARTGAEFITRLPKNDFAAGVGFSLPSELKTAGATPTLKPQMTETSALKIAGWLAQPIAEKEKSAAALSKKWKALTTPAQRSRMLDLEFAGREPYRPTLLLQMLEHGTVLRDAALGPVERPSLFGSSWAALDELYSWNHARELAREFRLSILSLPLQGQLFLVNSLLTSPLTRDNAAVFLQEVFIKSWWKERPDKSLFSVPVVQRNELIWSTFLPGIENLGASLRAVQYGIIVASEAEVGAYLAATGQTKTREGLLVAPGKVEFVEGRFRRLGDGGSVVVSVDGTADAGEWTRA